MLVSVLSLGFIIGERMWRDDRKASGYFDPSAGAAAVYGTLLIAAYGESAHEPKPVTHTTVLVKGLQYDSMEDNDIRGFLDGYFKWGWNQVSQVHVRAGRRLQSPRYGELELWRVLLRWDNIKLPQGAEVLGARLKLFIERGPPFPVDVFLYAVKKNWNPGLGGVDRNNISPPAPGEVWWGDASFQETPWGLPGVGFASDSDEDADTPTTALATAHYKPGNTSLQFSSSELVRYIGQRLRARQPLLFLLKLSDDDEDLPGSAITFYSANHGDIRNPKRRPHLYLQWKSPTQVLTVEKHILLEHGRTYVLTLPNMKRAQVVAVSFQVVDGFEQPTIEIRSKEDRSAHWRRVLLPTAVNGKPLDVRLRASIDPVILGELFESELRDTWVRRGAPESQDVLWTFKSPTGARHLVKAMYQGNYRWTVRFRPSELGRWNYWWTQNFAERPYKSSVGIFDVIPGATKSIRKQLLALRDQIRDSDLKTEAERVAVFGQAFMKLERAALRQETPETFRGKAGQKFRVLLRELRTELSGTTVPESIRPK
jgi:hypothetical protein